MIDAEGVVRCPLCGGEARREVYGYYCNCFMPYVFEPTDMSWHLEFLERARRAALGIGRGWSWWPRR